MSNPSSDKGRGEITLMGLLAGFNVVHCGYECMSGLFHGRRLTKGIMRWLVRAAPLAVLVTPLALLYRWHMKEGFGFGL